MAFQCGDVVLIPFPYTDLTATKTRPAIVVSSSFYHSVRPELLLAYVSSQVTKTHPTLDYLLADWSLAGLPKPSFVRPKLAAVEPTLVVHQVGSLSGRDQFEVDRCLRRAMALTETALGDLLNEVDLTTQPANLVQVLAEKSAVAVVSLAAANTPGVDVERLRKLLAI